MIKTPPIARVLAPVNKFIPLQYAGGIVLLAAVAVAILWANSAWADTYHNLWHINFGINAGSWHFNKELHIWINDFLMAIFFFVIGLELKREFMAGELSTVKTAALPMVAALGGMLVPALIYAGVNMRSGALHGWGIPMATDIAFALALLGMAGKHIPNGLKVFLSALAVTDDLGAVLVIAIFYTGTLNTTALLVAAAFFTGCILLNRLGVRSILAYLPLGLGLWLAFFASGVHATIAGVLFAFTIPAGTLVTGTFFKKRIKEITADYETDDEGFSLNTPAQHAKLLRVSKLKSAAAAPLQVLEDKLHPWVAFVIMPLFALANAGMHIGSDFFKGITNFVSIGVICGLLIGKFTGVSFFTWLMVRLNFASLPEGVQWRHILGMSLLAGIGFTMSIFIANLAFAEPAFIEQAKYGILVASFIAGCAGLWVLKTGKPATN